MSVHPLQAVHVAQMTQMAENLGGTQELMDELHRAHQEDMMGSALNATDEYIGESFATCDMLQNDFVRRTEKMKDRYERANEDGQISIAEGAWVMLKVRSVTKTLSRAERKKCEWVEQEKGENSEPQSAVDLTALKQFVGMTSLGNPCFRNAEAHLKEASNADAAGQESAVLGAMTILLSDDCKVSNAPFHAQPTPKELKEGAIQDVEEIDDNMEDLIVGAKDAVLQHPETASLLELTESLETGTSDGFSEILAKVLGFIALMLLWLFVCWVLAAVMMVILGLIMCLFKIVVTAFIRIFGSKAWNFDYGSCMNWWLSALGHTHSGGDIGISMCAASMMTGYMM
jgi:hypothetical protein